MTERQAGRTSNASVRHTAGSMPDPLVFARYDAVQVAGSDVYWIEGRPADGGRDVLVRWRPGTGATDVALSGHAVGTQIYGYGGGAYCASDQAVYFSSAVDGSLHAAAGSGVATVVSPGRLSGWCGDLEWVPGLRLLLAVHEAADAEAGGSRLLAFHPEGDRAPRVLAEGADFYAAPRASPDRRWLAWLSWDHPRMPWDCTSLWLAPLDRGGLAGRPWCIAGGAAESVFCPQWSPDSVLHFVSDRSGWWNLYRHREGRTEPVLVCEAELGLAPVLLIHGTADPITPAAQAEQLAAALHRSGRPCVCTSSTRPSGCIRRSIAALPPGKVSRASRQPRCGQVRGQSQ
jgi:hypothetical protein